MGLGGRVLGTAAVIAMSVGAALSARAEPSADATPRVAVIVSSRAGAFGAALRSIQRHLGDRALLIDITDLERAEASTTIANTPAAANLAVGPTAAQVALTATPTRPLIYCLCYRSRQRGFEEKAWVQGIPLSVSPRQVLTAVHEALPEARRVSVLFDPRDSSETVEQAATAARTVDLALEPISMGPGSAPR